MSIFKRLVFMSFVLPIIITGGVNIKNGNFYISYTDIIVPGGSNDLKITRTYNSKSTKRKSWFGMGWGSYFETFLTVSADGSVVVHEHGSGAKTRFTPKKAIDPTKAAKKIVEAMKKNSSMSAAVAKKKLEELKENAALRRAYARKLGLAMDLKTGTKLHSSTRGIQTVTVTKSGFERRSNDGKVEVFDKKGKLQSIQEKSGYKISLNYKKERLDTIKDSEGKQLFFEWYSSGLVKSIGSTGKKKAVYKYDAKHRLVESTDINGNVYKHSYDKNHNMTKIAYSDNTTMEISYHPRTQFATTVKARNGRKTEYEYGSDKKKPDLHYWTTITRDRLNGEKEKNRYEYEIGVRADGQRYTKRLATTVNGVTTETIYSDRHNLPEKITQGKNVTTFKYNDKGLLEKKASSDGEFVELSYHKQFNKITRVVNKKGWTNFFLQQEGPIEQGREFRWDECASCP